MTFPTINYKFNDLDEAQALTDLIEQKFTSLEKYLHRGNSGTCDVEFSKVSPQLSGKVHQVGVNLLVEGTLYRAEATEESFEKAIDEVRDELDKELRRAKDKQVTMDKQSGREAKEMMLNDM
ncbi:ribosome-associated translation inhibitor RaiA [Candidatus Nomurabacteria bacterium]|nr:ribosome-associated translation inhibitor RaiA [Candidatus Nomurabacteria bacterium]